MIHHAEWILPEYENNLAEFRHKLDLSITEMCSMVEVGYNAYRSVELGRTSIYKGDSVKPWILRLCKLFHCHLEDLFTREVCAISDTYTQEDFVELYNNHWSSHPYMDDIEYLELKLDMEKVLNGRLKTDFPSRLYEATIMYFFDDMTYTDIGKKYSVTNNAIYLNVTKALRILRGDMWRNGISVGDYGYNEPPKKKELTSTVIEVDTQCVRGATQIKDERYSVSLRISKEPVVKQDSNEQTPEELAREAFQFYEDYLNYLKSLNLGEES